MTATIMIAAVQFVLAVGGSGHGKMTYLHILLMLAVAGFLASTRRTWEPIVVGLFACFVVVGCVADLFR